MKTGSESIEAIIAQEADLVRGIFGAHRGHVRDVRRIGEGRGAVSGGGGGGQEKGVDEVSTATSGRLQPRTRDEGELRITVEQGVERFMAK